MKYLLVLAVVFIAIWLWRKGRRDEMRSRPPSPPPAPKPTALAPQAMLRCAHCGLHLPAADAINGPDGTVYCSTAHRQAAER
ncbi:MAG: hypothetical protein EOP82_05310 [Variovorax sp.]|nr:MAG: hypothetical protein EOP82_05310 [Variovorax sp.]